MGKYEKPYQTLGKHLRTVREHAKRSLSEVSGAVEIDETQLERIEEGSSRPDEDVMLLLISYFNMADQEALHLWELARYDSDLNEHLQLEQMINDPQSFNQMMSKPMVMLLSMDIRTMYSDGLDIVWNESGLTMNFTQTTANPKSKQRMPIARVGMSYLQAEKVLRTLELALLHAKYNGSPKLLPPSTSKDHNK
jgi:transcriptional regulator with XRE-family HTH domain